jgi:hypothetical protein
MATDVVCVLDATLAQVFQAARPIKATVKEESKAMEHPLETGATITDHRVILPVEIELSMVLTAEDYRGTYRQIRDLFAKGELLTVQTRTDSYRNMTITAMPHEETADAYDAINLGLTLKEVLYVAAQFSDLQVSKPADSRTVQRGEQQPQATTKKQSSILSGLFR